MIVFDASTVVSAALKVHSVPERALLRAEEVDVFALSAANITLYWSNGPGIFKPDYTTVPACGAHCGVSMADEAPVDDPWAAERSIACAGNKKENGTAEHAEHAENLDGVTGAAAITNRGDGPTGPLPDVAVVDRAPTATVRRDRRSEPAVRQAATRDSKRRADPTTDHNLISRNNTRKAQQPSL